MSVEHDLLRDLIPCVQVRGKTVPLFLYIALMLTREMSATLTPANGCWNDCRTCNVGAIPEKAYGLQLHTETKFKFCFRKRHCGRISFCILHSSFCLRFHGTGSSSKIFWMTVSLVFSSASAS